MKPTQQEERLKKQFILSAITITSMEYHTDFLFFIKNKIRTYNLQEQFTNYLQIHFYMVLIITEVLLEACFSEVPKLFNQPIIRFY